MTKTDQILQDLRTGTISKELFAADKQNKGNTTNQMLKLLNPNTKPLISQELVLPNHSGDHSKGLVTRTATNATDIANKTYADALLTDGNTFKAAAGTAAAPSFTFAADDDTGIYNSAANTINFTTNGVNRMSIAASSVLTIDQITSGVVTTYITVMGRIADGATSVGVIIDNATSLTTAGAKIASFKNAGTEKAAIDKDGVGIFTNGSIRIKRAVTNIAAASPTDAELDTAFGQPADLGSGFVGILDDNDAGTDCFLCWTTGTAGEWFYIGGTKAT